jgi:primase-polymerase (primpol)-like protein
MYRLELPDGADKPLKVPYYTDGKRRRGLQGSPEDRAKLTTFAEAVAAAGRQGAAGVGLAMLPEWDFCVLDFDNCVSPDGRLPDEVAAIAHYTYSEYSPSGKGIHAFVRGDYGDHKSPSKGNDFGFETFSNTGFLTFTGDVLFEVDVTGMHDTISDLDAKVAPLCAKRFTSRAPAALADDFMAGREPLLGLTPERMVELVNALDPDMGRDEWIRVGMALHHETDGDDTGLDLWDEWSAGGVTYPGTEGLRAQWDSFTRRKAPGRAQVTMASVIKMAKDAGSADHCAAKADQGEGDCIRRSAQRDQDRRIGDGTFEFSTTELHTLEEMTARFVFVKDGSQVADMRQPRLVLSLADFRNATAASTHMVQKGREIKSVPCVEVWRNSNARVDVETLTFRAGGDPVTSAPDGRRALNTWRPVARDAAPEGWAQQAQPFIEHVRWLWGPEADAFLDWLAHVFQVPGKLAHFGWLHIAPRHGMGRNWIAGVLARVWPSHVALGFDLSSTLHSGFNGRLAGKLLAVVDEIDEGNSGKSFQHAQTLKRLVTEETRAINPKYGRQHEEYNACRWLIFSNSETALPLEKGDRRFWVVKNDQPPKDADYYKRLYDVQENPEFIASVAEFFGARDISRFNPGAAPPMTDAKVSLLNCLRSEAETVLEGVTQRWPVDIVTTAELRDVIGESDTPNGAAWRHTLRRAGYERVGRWTSNTGYPVKVTAYSIRNHAKWAKASTSVLRAEVERHSSAEKKFALNGDEGDP